MSGVGKVEGADHPQPSSEVDGAQLAAEAPEETCFMGRIGLRPVGVGDIKRGAAKGGAIADEALKLTLGALEPTVFKHTREARRRLRGSAEQ